MPMWIKKGAGAIVLIVIGIACLSGIASADPLLYSSHYHLDESELGGSGNLQANSANYQVSEVIGDPAIGDTASANYQIEAGSKSTNDPALSFVINTASPTFSAFSAATTATTTATFSVLDYTSFGYDIIIAGSPPANSTGHTITAMSSTGSPVTGTEQFGINLVANTSPANFGADPNHGQFGYGNAATNYNTANQFRYVSGETIAHGPKSSGVTTYTISYIVNVSSLTPGGIYTSNQTLLCIGTY